MKNKNIVLIFFELIYLIILIGNIFYKFLNIHYIFLISIVLALIIFILFGFEKERLINKKTYIFSILLFTIVGLIIKYSIGLVTGYLYTPFDLSILGIIKNVIPLTLLIIMWELTRYIVINKCNSKVAIVFYILLITLLYINGISGFSNDMNFEKIVKFISTIFIVDLINNIVLSLMSKKFGYTVCILFSIIINLYIFILPIVPDLGSYNDTITQVLLTLGVYLLMKFTLTIEKKNDIRDNYVVINTIRTIMIVLIILLVSLNSNLFRFWIAVVGSGSMDPTIKIGDVVLIDKKYKERANMINEGDILVFKKDNQLFCHRVVSISEINDKYYFKTKGDRKGQNVDNWTVNESEIIGVTKLTIKKVGLPSIWLKNKMEEKNES